MNLVRKKQRKEHSLNLTSLIDVIFLLVVFFMLTNKFISYQAINLNIAQSKDLKNKSKNIGDNLIIELLPKENFILQNKIYSLNQLKEKILDITKTKNGDLSVFLVSKKNVYVKDVVLAMDQIKMAGINNISLVK